MSQYISLPGGVILRCRSISCIPAVAGDWPVMTLHSRPTVTALYSTCLGYLCILVSGWEILLYPCLPWKNLRSDLHLIIVTQPTSVDILVPYTTTVAVPKVASRKTFRITSHSILVNLDFSIFGEVKFSSDDASIIQIANPIWSMP